MESEMGCESTVLGKLSVVVVTMMEMMEAGKGNEHQRGSRQLLL